MPDERPPAGAAEEQHIVPEEQANGRIPVLQAELSHINGGIRELNAVLREYCKQAEETRIQQALIRQQQTANTTQIAAIATALASKANVADVEELRKLIKNPWVIALGSGGTVGIIMQIIPAVVKAFGGP